MKFRTSSVSVIIPCYCCSETIERAVRSVYKQTVLPREVILIEDYSPDNGKTKNKLDSIRSFYSKKFPQIDFKLIFNSVNFGPGDSRNFGWNVASSKYVAFLDADDSWINNKIQVQYDWMNNHSSVFLTCHLTQLYKIRTGFDKNKIQVFSQSISLFEMLFSNKISTRSVMVRNNKKYRFDNLRRYSEDYALWLRMLSDDIKIVRINQYLASTFRPEYSNGGQIHNLIMMEIGEIEAISQLKENGKIGTIRYLICILWSFLKFVKRAVVNYVYM